jgi:hypothetical protein
MPVSESGISAAFIAGNVPRSPVSAHDRTGGRRVQRGLDRIFSKIPPQLACCAEPLLEGSRVHRLRLMNDFVSKPPQGIEHKSLLLIQAPQFGK